MWYVCPFISSSLLKSLVVLFFGRPIFYLILISSFSHLKSARPNRHPTGPSCICARIFSCNVPSSSHNVSLFLLRERSSLISLFIAASGLLVGGTVGIIRSPHPGLFAIASGIQCGFMGMTFFSKCSDLRLPATKIEKTPTYKTLPLPMSRLKPASVAKQRAFRPRQLIRSIESIPHELPPSDERPAFLATRRARLAQHASRRFHRRCGRSSA